MIGNPIAQSKSPLIHGIFAEQTGQDMVYGRLEAPADGFQAAAEAFRREGGRGLNVTAPFKLDAFRWASSASERARQAGAVNCLKFEGGTIAAENFDGVGLRRDLEVNLRVRLAGARVLMLGAGGAARGALAPLLEAGVATLVVANRTAPKAEALVAEWGAGTRLRASGLPELAQAGGFDVVLNATSSSLRSERPEVPDGAFAAGSLAYDLSYGKGLTPFLRQAADAGITRLHDGVGMLVEQAAEAFLWWRGVRPATARAIRELTIPLV